MIDHVSVCVRDLEQATRFYQAVLGTIGYKQQLLRPGTAGFGKTYPEFWINLRQQMTPIEADSGSHAALRAPTAAAVDAFHAAALQRAANPTGRRAAGRSTAKAIMPPSFATLTAIALRP
jgi:catechol 2,3-dioxygenase-like lactoylglutathione lyase family enzyme